MTIRGRNLTGLQKSTLPGEGLGVYYFIQQLKQSLVICIKVLPAKHDVCEDFAQI